MSETSETSATSAIEPRSSYRGNETVLIVEDDEGLLALETMMLESNGYKVLTALTVDIANTLAQENSEHIDLLLTDVIMPEMNGWDLSISLLAIVPKMKVLFMSGYTADILASQGIIADEIQFLQKPFTLKTLTAKVREVLDA